MRDLSSKICLASPFLTGHFGPSHIELMPRLALQIRPAVAIFAKAAGTQRPILPVRNPDPTAPRTHSLHSFVPFDRLSALLHFFGRLLISFLQFWGQCQRLGDGKEKGIDEFCSFVPNFAISLLSRLWFGGRSNNLLDIGPLYPLLINLAEWVCGTFYTFHSNNTFVHQLWTHTRSTMLSKRTYHGLLM